MRAGYLAIEAREPLRVRRIDARAPPGSVPADIRRALDELAGRED